MINGVSITTPYVQPYHNTFVAKIVFMMGDADSYQTSEIPLTEEGVILMKNLFDHGVWDRDTGYSGNQLYKDLEEIFEDELGFYFPRDPDGWGAGRFNDLQVLWYDADGVQYNTEFWWS